jgi:hypothetical protein
MASLNNLATIIAIFYHPIYDNSSHNLWIMGQIALHIKHLSLRVIGNNCKD